jgi:hypothetical protein
LVTSEGTHRSKSVHAYDTTEDLLALATVAAMKGLSAEVATTFHAVSSDLATSL